MDIMKSIKETGIVPVVVLSDAADAVPLADALADGLSVGSVWSVRKC